MPFTFIFHPVSRMTAKQYEEVINRLEAVGAGHPKGRLYHIAYGASDNLHVTDVWDTIENFEAFGKVLMPILQELRIDPGQPSIQEVHRIIEDVVPV